MNKLYERRGISTLIKLFLLVIGVIAAWWLDRQQTDFGEQYAREVIAVRPELELQTLAFEGDVAQITFELVNHTNAEPKSEAFVLTLGKDLKAVFCRFVVRGSLDPDLQVPLLHVGVRLEKDDYSDWVLQHIYSKDKCR